MITLILLMACPGKRLPGHEPTAEELFTAHFAATTSQDHAAWDRTDQRLEYATLAMPRQGISTPVLTRFERPAKVVSNFEFPGIGPFEEGYDGELAWALDPTQGPRIKNDEETLRVAFDSAFDGDRDWAERYTDFRVMGLDECDGRPAWEVRSVTVLKDERRFWFDAKTGLMSCARIRLVVPFGEIWVTTTYRDWTDYDGIKLPTYTSTEMMMMEMTVTLDRVDLDPRDFQPIAPPEEVLALMEDLEE